LEDAVYLADETSLQKTQSERIREIVTQPAVHVTFVDTRSWQAGGVPEDTCAAREPEIGLVVKGQYATITLIFGIVLTFSATSASLERTN